MKRNKYCLLVFLLVTCALVVSSCKTKHVDTNFTNIANNDTIIKDTDTLMSDSLIVQAEDRTLAVPVGRVVGSKRVSSNSPTTIAAENVTLLIDSGAVSRDVEISILATSEEQSGTIPDHLANLTADGAVYRMLPDGQLFERDITIAMRYDSTALPYGYTADDIYTFFFNEQTHMWQQVERDSVDTQNQIVYSRTNHFTDYINGVLKVPESSDAMAYTPTSIKDLKAADPLEGITLMAPPEANSKGTANLTYPLTIPAGCHGMQPQLAVSYNSAGGNGILGLGWNLPISEISIDTRRGVPLYSDTLESETYMLDGEVLVTSYTDENNGLLHLNRPAYARKWKSRENGRVQFFTRVEGAFKRIERYGTSPQNYRWVVTDKNGTKYYYGRTSSSCLRDGKGNIAKWCLENVEDTYGNAISYNYFEYAPPSALIKAKSAKQILLRNINYTGYWRNGVKTDGKYNIDFSYDTAKHDAVTSARYGFPEANAVLLDHIDVSYNGMPIRSYYFGYKLGVYEKTLLCNIIEIDPVAKDFGCIDCGDDSSEGEQQYHESIISCYRETQKYIDSLNWAWYLYRHGKGEMPTESLSDISIRYYDCLLSDTVDDYSDHNITGKILTNPVYLRSVYDRCYATESHCKYLGFNEHRFEYSERPLQMFSDVSYIKNENGESDSLEGSLFLMSGSPGPIDGTSTKSWNIGGALDVGYGWNTILKNIAAGGGYTYSTSNSEGLISLIDLNGDGLTDKIYKRDEKIYYRLRKTNPDSIEYFSQETLIPDIDDFLSSTSESDSWIVEGSLSAGLGASFGLNWTDGYSTVKTYLCDMDGDGLPDIVSNGQTYYNRINDPDKEDFVAEGQDEGFIVISSCEKYDTIYLGQPVDEWIFEDYVDSSITICDTTVKICPKCKIPNCGEHPTEYEIICHPYTYTRPRPYSPNLENVRFWVAPREGRIRIKDTVQMHPLTTTMGDGVRLIVQYRENSNYLANQIITPGTDASIIDDTFYVYKGDKIFFRMLSRDNHTADRLRWNPEIYYFDETYGIADGVDSTHFSYEEDYLLSGYQKIKMPFDAQVRIEATAYDSTGSGPLYTTTLKVLVNGADSLHFDIDGTNDPQSRTMLLHKEDSIQVHIEASNDINWSNIKAQCSIRILQNTSTNPDDTGFVCLDTLSHPGDTVYFFEYWPHIQKLVNTANQTDMYRNYTKEEYGQFGTMYRNWGQFGFKSSGESSVIHENLLNTSDITNLPTGSSAYTSLPDNPTITLNDPDNPETNVNIGNNLPIYNPLAATFYPMLPDFKHDCWSAYSDYAYVERSLVSNVPHPADGMTITQIDSMTSTDVIPTGTVSPYAINKQTYNKSFGISGSVSLNLGVINFDGSKSRTTSESRQLADMMDINGDGLPDVLSETRVQYTHPAGGLSSVKDTLGYGDAYVEHSYDTIKGGSFGGSAIYMHWQPSRSSRTTTKEISGNVGSNTSETEGTGNNHGTWIDLNGDGLPDKVLQTGGKIYYYQNIGYGFMPKTYFCDNLLRHSASKGSSGGASLSAAFEKGWWNKEGALLNQLNETYFPEIPTLTNVPRVPFLGDTAFVNRLKKILEKQAHLTKLNVSISAGFGSSTSENENDIAPIDLNGDGLPDRVMKYRNGYIIYFNTGNGFDGSYARLLLGNKNHNISMSTDLSGAITAGVTLGIIPLKIEVNPKGGLSRSLSRTTATWMDMNADGVPDYVWDAGDDYIGVKYSNLGNANKLVGVTLPSGGSYQMAYQLNDDGPKSNMRHYVMSSLTVKDNRMQAPDLHRSFQYTNRYYDRIEREDYGYAEVVTQEDSATITDYRHTVQEYHNRDYLFQGLCYSTSVIDGQTGDTLSGRRTEYRLFEIASGNLIPDSHPGCHGDGYPAVLSDSTLYYDDGQRQIVSRLRFGYTALGNIDTVYDDGALNDPGDDYVAATVYGYLPDYISVVTDEHVFHGGNTFRYRKATHYPTGDIQTLTFQNNAGGDAVHGFKYDGYGNIEHWEHPENHQGQHFFIHYTYDNETHSLPTETTNAYGLTSRILYDYRWQKPVWTMSVNSAQTEYKYDSKGRLSELYAPFEYGTPHPTIRYDYYDRYPKTSAYWTDSNLWARTLNDNNGANYIGTVTISDGLGRPRIVKKEAVVNGLPMRIVGGYAELDALGRKVREYYPDTEALSAPDSTFNSPLSTLNSQLFYDRLDRVTKTIYPDGTFSTSDYTVGNDADGILRLEVEATDQNRHISYVFSNVRQQPTTSVDPLGAATVFHYDHIGQLQESIDPEGHSTYHAYDMLGRRTGRIHPSAGHTQWDYDAAGNMLLQTQNDGQWIEYKYEYNRPVHIKYSNRPWNNVWYKYGSSGTAAGRVVCQQDATGVQEFRYDSMGNVTFNRHTYVQPHNPSTFTLTTKWKYDSWGRIHNIVYPDGEKVEYSYDYGGLLQDIQGDNTYIESIQYDHFGQRTSMVDGDNIKTTYTYDTVSRRLIHLRDSSSVTGEILQDNTYRYDPVGNIISIQDSGRNQRTQIYEYDDADRLIRSEGRMPHEFSTLGLYDYISSYDYSDAGRLNYKAVTSNRYNTAFGAYSVQYNNEYRYDNPNNPFAVTEIHGNDSPNYIFKWDDNGNMIYAEGGKPYFDRSLCWTEDNRLQAFMERGDEGGIAAWYNYSADGERNFKLTSPRLDMQQNATLFGNPPLLIPTLYASPLITLTAKGYTKHYFEEGRRVCSKLGGGFRRRVPVVAIDKRVPELAYDYDEQFHHQHDGVEETFGNCVGAWPELIDKYDLHMMLLDYKGDEKPFFYHSDHLGSAAYLTSGGHVTQTLNYLPYGEDWVDIQNNLDPRLGQYTFNGKEKDYESGFHYYGARYYWSEVLTGWLSVDPMMDKYQSISPYNYCVWNPVNTIDPNGMDSVRTPIGMANAGTGYKATPNGQYLYGEGLQTKCWNPDLEIGGVVGEGLRGGYEDWGAPSNIPMYIPGSIPLIMESEYGLPPLISPVASLYDGLGSKNISDWMAITGEGHLIKAEKMGFGKGLSWRNGKMLKHTTIGKIARNTSYRMPVVSIVTSGVEIGISAQHNGWDSRITYSTIGGNVLGIGTSMFVGFIVCGPMGFAAGFVVGILANYGGGLIGEQVYDLTH